MRKQRKSTSQHTAHKHIRRNRTRRGRQVRIHQIPQRALEDGEEAETEAAGADAEADPVRRFLGCPCHDEEAPDEKEGPDHHGWQTRFGDYLAAVGNEALLVEHGAPHDYAAGEEDADYDGDEGDGADESVPVPDLIEFEREGWDGTVVSSQRLSPHFLSLTLLKAQ